MKKITVALCWLLLGCGCSDPPVVPGVPERASLVIITETTGPEPDPDGYSIAVETDDTYALSANDTLRLELRQGVRNVDLSGNDINCFPSTTSSEATLTAGDTTRVVFSLLCKATLRNKIVFISTRDGQRDIYAMNPDGSDVQRLLDWPSEEGNLDPSPDRTQLLFTSNIDSEPGRSNIWVMDVDGTNFVNLTNTRFGRETDPRWSPDGTRIAYRTHVGGNEDIYVMDADGTDKRRLTTDPAIDINPAWSPDGEVLVFQSDRNNEFGLYVMNSHDGSNPRLLVRDVADPDWSPDGQWIVGWSSTGSILSNEIFVVRADGTDRHNVTNSTALDISARWSPTGSMIVFTSLRPPATSFDIFTMDADGNNQRRVTDFEGPDAFAVWSSP